MTLRPVRHDNGGTIERPYGHVYFNDGTRTAYAVGVNIGEGDYNLFTEDGPQSSQHIEMAEVYLFGVFGPQPEWYPHHVS